MITAITPTGDRPVAFELCRRWVEHQTVRPDQWIVVDDGRQPMDPSVLPPFALYLRREPGPKDPRHTVTVNIAQALPHIAGEKILILEDDEYYAPGYVEAMARALEGHDIVGLGDSKYYHLPSGGWERWGNMDHASLAQTGIRDSLLGVFAGCVAQGMEKYWLDDRLWKHVQANRSGVRILVFADHEESLYVGMKGLPGRNGICVGHNPGTYRKHVDGEGRPQLRAWIPKDWPVYLELLERMRDGRI